MRRRSGSSGETVVVEGALVLQESYRTLIHQVDVSNFLVIRESSRIFTQVVQDKSQGLYFTHSLSPLNSRRHTENSGEVMRQKTKETR